MSKLPLTKKLFSSCFSTMATTLKSKPYLHLGSPRNLYDPTRNKDNVLKFDIYDPTGNKEVVKNLEIQDQSQILRNLFKESRMIGSSRGYLALRNKKDSSVHLVDISSDQMKPKIISLPPLHFDKRETHVINVSVSSAVNGDFIVAVKFHGSKLSLCRVGDSEWTQIDVPCPSFEYSYVIYSERDERFYLNNWDQDCTGLIDLTPKSGLVTPPVIGYPFPIDLEDYNYQFEEKLSVEELFVESPSGQLFLVCRSLGDIVKTQKKIVVFKQDEEEEICSYSVTKDIGDLCIFIGENDEAFCVSASEYPGLKPNSVYFANHSTGVGIWDLSSEKVIYYHPHDFLSLFMCWIPPTPTLTPISKS